MKKVITLLLAAGLVIGAASAANAVDIKAKGLWHNAMSFADRNFEKHNGSDKMQNATRIRTQIDVIASESLKGVVYFEIGPQNWGKGADGAGITLSTQFTKNIGATLFWLRAENDNTDSATDYGKQYHYSDAMDFTGITLPLKFDGVKVTPWAMYGFVGRDSFENAGASGDQKKLLQGLLPLGVSNKTLTGNSLTDRHGDAWWAGFTTELKVLDPFRFALDATYGRVDLGEGLSTKGKKIDVKREGWIVSALAEYKMESVTPGLTAWYSSGDDANVNNGSERLPTINPDVKVTSYGFDGTNFCRAQQVLGTSVDGTFGIVAHLKDISFFEDLSHTLRVAFYRGTNNTENVRQKMITKPSETVSSMYYMTTADKAWEVNVDSEYKIYKNLSLFLELGYIRMDLDSNVWKDYESKKNNFKGAVCVLYSF